MPELPEVETIVRRLKPSIEGLELAKIELKLARLAPGLSPKKLERSLAGKRLDSISRRGKYIIILLEEQCLIIHLGMTGQLTFSPANFKENNQFLKTVTGLQKPMGVHSVDKHTHLILTFISGERLLFRDPRTFGKIFLSSKLDWMLHSRIIKLGPEPLNLKIKSFVTQAFAGKSMRSIKAFLLDQEILAGVGNIYADEALFMAGICPSRLTSKLTPSEQQKLMQAVKKVLQKGILNQGTTFSDYRQPDGTMGKNQERLMVYGRGTLPCRRCNTILVKTVVAQRGTVYCPMCQAK